jgi:CBS domain-containing protein
VPRPGRQTGSAPVRLVVKPPYIKVAEHLPLPRNDNQYSNSKIQLSFFEGDDAMTSLQTAATTAADVMNRDVVTLDARASLHDAMQIMTEHHVSGVPVVDQQNQCIGVISTSDVVSFIEADLEALESEIVRTENWFNPETQKWEESVFSSELLGEYDSVPVSDVMTSNPLTVLPTQPIANVARLMTSRGIHRVFVVDEEKRLQGVISAFDFVQLVAGH